MRPDAQHIVCIDETKEKYHVALFSKRDRKGIMRHTVKYRLVDGKKHSKKARKASWQQFQLTCREKNLIVQGYIDSRDRGWKESVRDYLYEPLQKILSKRLLCQGVETELKTRKDEPEQI